MKRFVLAVQFALVAVTPALAVDTYTFDPEYTIPVFEVGHLGFTTQRGRFDKTEGKVVLDLGAKTGQVEFTVFTSSLDMGSRAWTVHVSSEGLFNVDKYPTLTFKSDKLVFDGGKVVAAEGQLTMLGVTRPVRVMVNRFTCGIHPVNKRALCAGDIAATINRSEFGMNKYIPTVSDEIRISVPVEAYRD